MSRVSRCCAGGDRVIEGLRPEVTADLLRDQLAESRAAITLAKAGLKPLDRQIEVLKREQQALQIDAPGLNDKLGDAKRQLLDGGAGATLNPANGGGRAGDHMRLDVEGKVKRYTALRSHLDKYQGMIEAFEGQRERLGLQIHEGLIELGQVEGEIAVLQVRSSTAEASSAAAIGAATSDNRGLQRRLENSGAGPKSSRRRRGGRPGGRLADRVRRFVSGGEDRGGVGAGGRGARGEGDGRGGGQAHQLRTPRPVVSVEAVKHTCDVQDASRPGGSRTGALVPCAVTALRGTSVAPRRRALANVLRKACHRQRRSA